MIVTIFNFVYSQSYEHKWTKYFSLDSFNTTGNEIIECQNGGYAVVGAHIDPPNDNIGGNDEEYISFIKVGEDGDEIWNKVIGSPGQREGGRGLIETNDNGFLIVGYSESDFNGYITAYALKFDANGNILWEYKLYDNGQLTSIFESAIESENNTYIITGNSKQLGSNPYMDILLVELDQDGNELSFSTYGENNNEIEDSEYGLKIIQSSDGNYILLGAKYFQTKTLLLKFDNQLNLLEEIIYDEISGKSIIEKNNNLEFFIAGESATESTGWDFSTFLIDNDFSNDNILQQNSFNFDNGADYVQEINQRSDSILFVGGHAEFQPPYAGFQASLMAMRQNGDIIDFYFPFGSDNSDFESRLYDFAINSDDQLIITGRHGDSLYISKHGFYDGPAWYVSSNGYDYNDGSSSSPFATIQKGIDMASDGDTVFVKVGTYVESINFNDKNVIVIGDSRDSTFIDGEGINRIINLNGNNNVVLENFTLKNGYSNWGGALLFNNGDTLKLNHCNFFNNSSEQGGGVFNSNGGVVDIFNCFFENNSSVNGRSVINIGNDVNDENSNISISIKYSIFNDNSSDSKGAVNVWAADSVEISNCTFSNNFSGSYAGALNVHDVNYFIMEHSKVLNNHCVTGSGGGISTWDLSYGLINNSSIIGNISEQGNGGGIVLWSNANMEIINSTIADNQAQSAQDLFIKHNSTLKLENSVVYNRNTYDQIGLYDSFLEFDDIEQACTLTLQGANLIRGGLTHIYKDTLSTINSNGSLILSNPLFCEPENGDYTLAENSPLISLLYQENIQVGTTSTVGCGPINPYPVINLIENQEIFEDEQLSINILASSELGLELSYYAESNSLEMPVSMDSTVLSIEPQDDWNGVSIVSVFVFDTNGLYDSTSFEVTVLPINDSPTNFELIYPTVLDTIPVSVDTDETVPFTWGRSMDVDSEVLYKLTITLDYFGTSYTNEYENIADTTFGVSAYEYAILMTNLNLPRWNIDYTIEASDGEYTIMSDDGEFVFDNTSLSIEKSMLPKEFALYQNYPNPFNPITSLRYDLPNDGLVNITIYDMMGRIVKTLVNGSQTAGFKSVQWNATNDRNEPVSAGLYLYTIQAGEFRQTKKMVLLK